MMHWKRALLICFLLSGLVVADAPHRQTHERLHSVLWVQTSAEFEMALEQVFRSAELRLSEALDDPFWTAATEQSGNYALLPPAVVFDIDETVLDNSPFQARLAAAKSDYVHSEWQRWVAEGQADALPGAARFVTFLRSRGVTPIFVSNRSGKFKAQTVKNLRKALGYPGLPAEQVMLKGERPEWTSDKTTRRQVVCQNYRIVFLFGDVFDDFVELGHLSPEARKKKAGQYRDHWGKRWFLLPNPCYGNWERAIYDFKSQGDHAVLKRKFDSLQTKE